MKATNTGWESTSPPAGPITHPSDVHAPAILLGQRVRCRNDLRRDSLSSIASSLALDLDLESSDKGGESGSYAERDGREFESRLPSQQRNSMRCIQDHRRTLEAYLDRSQPEAMVIDNARDGQISKSDLMRFSSHQSAVRSHQKCGRYRLGRNINGNVLQAWKQTLVTSLPTAMNTHISASKVNSPILQTRETFVPDAQRSESMQEDASSEVSFATAGEGSEDEDQPKRIEAEKKADKVKIEECEWEEEQESLSPSLKKTGFHPLLLPHDQDNKPQAGVKLPSRKVFAPLLSTLSRLTGSASQVNASHLLQELLVTEPQALQKVRANNFAHYLSLAQQSGVPIHFSSLRGNPKAVWFRIHQKHLKEWNLTDVKAETKSNLAKMAEIQSCIENVTKDAQDQVSISASSLLLPASSSLPPASSPLLTRLVEPSTAVLALISELVKLRNAGKFGRVRAKELVKHLPGVNDVDTLKMVVHLARLAGASIECDKDADVLCKL